MSLSIVELSIGPKRGQWSFLVPGRLCAGGEDRPFLFGGSGLAVCVAAMQAAEGRALTWVTAQYLAYATLGETLTIEVAEAARGRNTAQLKATARVGERVVITAQASAGQQPDQGYRQLIGAPAVSPPLHCPVVAKHGERSGGVSSQFEYRLIRGRYPTADTAFDGPGDGRLTFWVRPRDQVRTDACLIAIVADFVSDALSDAVGRYVHASSIDNTLRLGPIEDSDWLICDVTIEALHGGVGHGSMRIFSETGRLLALASTSLIVRSPRRGA